MLKLNGKEVLEFKCRCCGTWCDINRPKPYLPDYTNEENAAYYCYCCNLCKKTKESNDYYIPFVGKPRIVLYKSIPSNETIDVYNRRDLNWEFSTSTEARRRQVEEYKRDPDAYLKKQEQKRITEDANPKVIERRKNQATKEELETFRYWINHYKEQIKENESTIEYENRYKYRHYESKIYACEEAIKRYKESLKRHLKNIPDGFSLLEKASILSDFSNYKLAITCYDEYLKSHPNNIDCLVGKAKALYYLNKKKETIICCDKILKLNPNNWDAKYYKKEIKREQNYRRIGYIVICCIIITIVLVITNC